MISLFLVVELQRAALRHVLLAVQSSGSFGVATHFPAAPAAALQYEAPPQNV